MVLPQYLIRMGVIARVREAIQSQKHRYGLLRPFYFFAMAALVMICAFPTAAQESRPEDACTPTEEGRYRLSGGAELGGDGFLLSCNGTQWVKVFGFETDGVFRPQFTNTAACADGDALVYDGTTGGIRCGAESVLPPPALCAPEDLVWTLHTTPGGRNYTSPAYGNGRFVAYTNDAGGDVISSTDGISWTVHTSSTRGPIAYGNGRFVMVNGTSLAVSTDGQTWTHYNNRLPNNGSWSSVAYGSAGFVAVSDDDSPSLVAHSVDGQTWTGVNVNGTAPGGRWTKVIYGGGRYVASCGWCQDGNGSGIMSSTDGLNWSAGAGNVCGSWSMAYGNGRYVGGSCWQEPLVHSTDGVNWTTGGWIGSQPASLVNITYGAGIGFIGTAEGNPLSRSLDGLNWSNINIPGYSSWISYPNAITYGNGMFLIAGEGVMIRGVCPA